ncbi:hypothetical protein V6N11_058003 [Hibiscus sabdariffa]|uniref:Trehalose-6-phosphate synthase n=1 Tax=Hibiscus sabdariffa TaxID=183260 RepID=A0ABR2P4C5_9ROSI
MVVPQLLVKTQEKKRFPRVASVPRLLYELPLQAHQNKDGEKWCFSWDEDSLLLQLKDGLGEDVEQHLWHLFHYILPLSPDLGGWFDRSLWQAYVSVNKIFADKVVEVISPDDEYVWVHDYHLMVLLIF